MRRRIRQYLQNTQLMSHETSTLILLGDNARLTKEQLEEQTHKIDQIVKKSIEGNSKHRVITVDTRNLPKIIIKLPEGEDREEEVVGHPGIMVVKIIQEYLNEGNVTVLAYLSETAMAWITLKESLPPNPVFSNVTTIHHLY